MTWQEYTLWMAGEIKWPVTVMVSVWMFMRAVAIEIDYRNSK